MSESCQSNKFKLLNLKLAWKARVQGKHILPRKSNLPGCEKINSVLFYNLKAEKNGYAFGSHTNISYLKCYK